MPSNGLSFSKSQALYVQSYKNIICKIDPLKYLLSRTTLIEQMVTWVMLLSEFDIQHVDCKSIKGQVIIDRLVEAPLTDAQPLITEFLDEHLCNITKPPSWKLYFDGSFT